MGKFRGHQDKSRKGREKKLLLQKQKNSSKGKPIASGAGVGTGPEAGEGAGSGGREGVKGSSKAASSGHDQGRGRQEGGGGGAKKKLKHVTYGSEHSVLICGDGDFSFTRGVIRHRGTGAGVVATSLDSREGVLKKYPRAETWLPKLHADGAQVVHSVDATRLEETLLVGSVGGGAGRGGGTAAAAGGAGAGEGAGAGVVGEPKRVLFDRVVFNFPHTGKQRTHLNRNLIRDFFASTKVRACSRCHSPASPSAKVPVRVPLAGEELRAFRDEENRKRRLEAEEEEQRRHTAAMEKEQVIADSDDEGEGEEEGQNVAEPTPKRRREIVASLFSKYSKPQHLMFGYYDPQIPTDEYGVKETEPIGWLAAAMQQQNSEMPAAMEEEGAAHQEARGKAVDDKEPSSGDEADDGDGGEATSAQGPVDALRAGAAGGKESAFFQDSGAVPTKLEQEEQEVDVLCRVVYVDSEGLSDGYSMKNTVLNLAPKMLIVTGGSRRAKAELVSHVRKQLGGDISGGAWKAVGGAGGGGGGGSAGGDDGPRYVLVDKGLEPIPVALDSGAFDVLLHDSLHTQLKWKQLNNYGVAHMECRVDPRGITPLLCAKPRGEKAGHPAMFLSVGNVNIMQLQKSLVLAGVSVKFLAGTLLCEGGVSVRVGEGGKMELDGPLCDEYFRVREVVYRQYVIV